MRELTDQDFDRLNHANRDGLAFVETQRKAAARRFWTVVPIGTAILLGQLYYFYRQDLFVVGLFIFLFGGLVTWLVANWGLMKVNDALKGGMLTEAARIAGLRYAPKIDAHPVLDEAHAFLFPADGSPVVTDLFAAELEDGRKIGFFEMSLGHDVGDDDNEKRVTDFSGQMFVFSRAEPGEGVVAVRSRQGIEASPPHAVSVKSADLSVSAGRVDIAADPPFDAAFDVIAGDREEALAMLTPEVRGVLLDLRATERVWLYRGPRYFLVGLWGRDRFESGNLRGKRPLEDSVRAMVNDLNESIRMLQRLMAVLG